MQRQLRIAQYRIRYKRSYSGSATFAVKERSAGITTANFKHNFARTLPQTPQVAFSTSPLTQLYSRSASIRLHWHNGRSMPATSRLLKWQLPSNISPFSGQQSRLDFSSVPGPMSFWGRLRQVKYIIKSEFGSLKAASAPVYINFPFQIPNFNTSIARAFITGYTLKSGT